jgi:hypothetical protein
LRTPGRSPSDNQVLGLGDVDDADWADGEDCSGDGSCEGREGGPPPPPGGGGGGDGGEVGAAAEAPFPVSPKACTDCKAKLDSDLAQMDSEDTILRWARAMLCQNVLECCEGNCSVHSRELEVLCEAIKDNNVLFQQCNCKNPKFAMNWLGKDRSKKQYSRWGNFRSSERIRSNFRSKAPVSDALKRLQTRGKFKKLETISTPHSAAISAAPSGSAESKRKSPGGEPRSAQKKQAQAEAIHPPPPTPAREGQPSRGAASAEISGVCRSPLYPGNSLQTATAAHQAAAHQSAPANFGGGDFGVDWRKNEYFRGFREVLQHFPWTEGLLQYFFVREKQSRLQDAKIQRLFQHTIDGWRRDQQSIDRETQSALINQVKATFLPYNIPGGRELNSVVDVLSYSLSLLIEEKPDAEKPPNWPIVKGMFPLQRTVDDFEGFLNKLVNEHEWSITDILPESSFGIFFRMPSWVAELVLLVIEHNVIVKDQLIRQGYRAFWPLQRSALLHSNTPSTDFKIAFEGVRGDIPEDYFSLICGYNIRECPLWVPRPDGISFSGHGISQEHRDLLKKLADEYRQRVAREEAAEMEVEEMEVEEEGEEAMEASEAEKTRAEANQATGAADSSVAPPASTDPHTFTLSAAAAHTLTLSAVPLLPTPGVAGSSGSLGVSKQTHPHVYSATEVGAAITAASEAVDLRNKLNAVCATCRQTDKQVRMGGREVSGWGASE